MKLKPKVYYNDDYYGFVQEGEAKNASPYIIVNVKTNYVYLYLSAKGLSAIAIRGNISGITTATELNTGIITPITAKRKTAANRNDCEALTVFRASSGDCVTAFCTKRPITKKLLTAIIVPQILPSSTVMSHLPIIKNIACIKTLKIIANTAMYFVSFITVLSTFIYHNPTFNYFKNYFTTNRTISL